ncbi:MAG TPA: hypothetical protein VIN40_04270 [Candidatus Tyrphobacter sp.]
MAKQQSRPVEESEKFERWTAQRNNELAPGPFVLNGSGFGFGGERLRFVLPLRLRYWVPAVTISKR